jgi:hypothetical protein
MYTSDPQIHYNCNAITTLRTQWDIGDQYHTSSRVWSIDKDSHISTRLRETQNNNFIQEHTILRRTMLTLQSTIHNPQSTASARIKIIIFGYHSPCSACLEVRKRSNVDLNRASNKHKYIPEIPSHISHFFRSSWIYNIWNQYAIIELRLLEWCWHPDSKLVFPATPSTFQHWRKWTSSIWF